MTININELSFNVDFGNRQFKKGQTALFLLHGFTGCTKDWSFIYDKLPASIFPIAVDLIGHGSSTSPGNINYYNSESISEQLKIIIENFTGNKIFLLGYSMGGRAALTFALKYPQKIKALILESASAGIKSEHDKMYRIKKDEALAEFILNDSMEKFIEYWRNMEIFNTQKRFSNTKLEEIRRSKLENNAVGLANSLRGFGTGVMPNYDNALKTFLPQTLLITGELDTKFTILNSELSTIIPNAIHTIIKNAGHNTHLEEPGKFVGAVNKLLLQF